MKFTLSWLKDHLDTTASLEEITSKLTMIGLEVEDVYNPAEALSIFRVAKILEAEKHPDADKLKLCKVEAQIDGELKVLQVVCGAPNARTGLLGVFAPPGATIPSNGMVLKPTKIRGIESNGMMCSESELELSEDHDGIIEIAEGVAVGTPAVDALNLNDPVIEIAITPNRPDCLGVYGVARDLAAAGLGTLKTPSQPSIQEGFESSIKIELDFAGEETVLCPHFSGRLIKGVKNGTSPAWMQSRLRAIGLRPINTLVDITNYVTFDRGRPLHVYDAAKVSGNIVARMGKGETFEALDGKEYKAENSMCVIADSANVLGFGGIMGGQASGSTEETTDVFVESAYFDPYKTAATGRKTGINSDARFRFERGIDPASVEEGCDIGTALILELCGGQGSTREVAGELAWQPLTISFDPQRVTRLTGVALENSEITTILTNLGFGVTPEGERLSVAVPSWRPDVFGEADLVEEVVRIHGLHEVVSTPLKKNHAVADPVLNIGQQRQRNAKRALAARGMLEAVSWSFVSKAEADLFGGGQPELALANPISVEMSDMRPSLLPGLIAATGRNISRGYGDVAVFEAGQTYQGEKPEEQRRMASGLRQGTNRPFATGRHWQGAAGKVDVFDAKADVEAVLATLGVSTANLQCVAEAPAWYHPGRSGVLRMGPKNIIAYFGEVHPRVLDQMDVAGPIVAFEIFLDAIPKPKAKATKNKPAMDSTDLQPVQRDFAFIVGKSVSADKLLQAAKRSDSKLISGVSLFDVFEGGSLGADEKSLAIEVTLQPRAKTLTDEELEAVSSKIVAAVTKVTGGTLRG